MLTRNPLFASTPVRACRGSRWGSLSPPRRIPISLCPGRVDPYRAAPARVSSTVYTRGVSIRGSPARFHDRAFSLPLPAKRRAVCCTGARSDNLYRRADSLLCTFSLYLESLGERDSSQPSPPCMMAQGRVSGPFYNKATLPHQYARVHAACNCVLHPARPCILRSAGGPYIAFIAKLINEEFAGTYSVI